MIDTGELVLSTALEQYANLFQQMCDMECSFFQEKQIIFSR